MNDFSVVALPVSSYHNYNLLQLFSFVIKKADPFDRMVYGFIGSASGVWLYFLFSSCCNLICRCFTSSRLSCLHLGQNSGKFFNSVSALIFTRVLCLQSGHKIHSVFIISTFRFSGIQSIGPYRSSRNPMYVSSLFSQMRSHFCYRPVDGFHGDSKCALIKGS